jgi:predicted CoA-binding protein
MDPILLRLLVGGDPTENCQMVYKCMKYMKDKGNNIDPINPLDVHTKVGVKFFKRFKRINSDNFLKILALLILKINHKLTSY